jgi:hypothetical protein
MGEARRRKEKDASFGLNGVQKQATKILDFIRKNITGDFCLDAGLIIASDIGTQPFLLKVPYIHSAWISTFYKETNQISLSCECTVIQANATTHIYQMLVTLECPVENGSEREIIVSKLDEILNTEGLEVFANWEVRYKGAPVTSCGFCEIVVPLHLTKESIQRLRNNIT